MVTLYSVQCRGVWLYLDNLLFKDAMETQLADLRLSLWDRLSVRGHHQKVGNLCKAEKKKACDW